MTSSAVAYGLAFLVGACSVNALAEFTGLARFLSRQLKDLAVELLPEAQQEVRDEEWAAEWDAWDRADVLRLLWCAGLVLAAKRSLASHRRGQLQETRKLARSRAGWRRVTVNGRVVFVPLARLQEVIWCGEATCVIQFEGREYFVPTAELLAQKLVDPPIVITDSPLRVSLEIAREGAFAHVRVQATALVPKLVELTIKQTIWRNLLRRGRPKIRLVSVGTALMMVRAPAAGAKIAITRKALYSGDGGAELVGVVTTDESGIADRRVQCEPSSWDAHDLAGVRLTINGAAYLVRERGFARSSA